MLSPGILPAMSSHRLLLLAFASLLLFGCPTDPDDPEPPDPDPDPELRPVDYVDPLIGAGGIGFGIGAAFPGPTAPFGRVRLGPDTSLETGAMGVFHCAGYWYEDDYIEGFSHLHLNGTGVTDYGNVMFMPTLGMDASKTSEVGYRQAFGHEREEVAAGYYSVIMDDTAIQAELTATPHTGLQRYTFPQSDEAVVLLDLAHTLGEGTVDEAEVHLDPDYGEIEGYIHNVGEFTSRVGGVDIYFVARFSRPPTTWGTWEGDELLEGDAARTGEDIGAWFGWSTSGNEEILVQTGISHIDMDHARANLEAEHTAVWDFDAVRWGLEGQWNDLLSLAEVTGGTEDERILFYSMLYKVFLTPTNYVEVGGDYLGFDNDVHYADGFTYYTELSMWDTFRTLHPLLVLIAPDVQTDILISMRRMQEQGGSVPKWALHTGDTGSMIGTPADIVFADSYLKGLTDGYDVDEILDELVAHATSEVAAGGRSCMQWYLDLGYVPFEECGDATSRTLEFAVNDFAVAQLAYARSEDAIADELYAQSLNYLNLWNPETGFFQGRTVDGAWKDPFDPTDFADDYTEATAWQYLWHVQHDAAGLADLMGGVDAFAERMEEMFQLTADQEESPLPSLYYWQGNEPDIHAPFMAAELGRPETTQRWVRWIMENEYDITPAGLAGNDDCGTLSAWYVFAALGIYPIVATDRYTVASPIFDEVVLHLPAGDLTITAANAGPDNVYVESLTLNGQPVDAPLLTHSALAGGGTLEFVMSPSPTDWGRF